MEYRDEKKFEKIYEEYVGLVYFVISKYVDDKRDVEDLTNEVFVDFSMKMNCVKNVKYYLVNTAKQMAIKYSERNGRAEVVYEEKFFDNGQHYDTGYFVITADMKKVLADEEIDLIISHVIFGKTFKEIAKEQSRPLKTVYSTYRRAIARYRKHLESRGK